MPSLAEAGRRIAQGTLTAERLLELCLDTIARREAGIAAWTVVDAERALAAARLKDKDTVSGVLHGIPFGVKDIIETAGLPTSYGSPIFGGHIPPRDAGCVALLKEAGAICLGKTVSTELGHVSPGPTRNPHDLARTPGGSSSGSAAAVGAGMVPFALGTQTTGSIARPAAYCGVVGYKPTYGDVTNSGVFPNAPSFDTVGVLCLAVEDLPLLRSALLRREPRPLQTPAPDSLRIGVLHLDYWEAATASMRDVIESAVTGLRRSGASITDVPLPPSFEAAPAAHRRVSGYEFSRGLSWERQERLPQLSAALVGGRLADGLSTSLEDYHVAKDELVGLRAQFASIAENYDVLLTPAAPGEAPLGIDRTGDPIFNTIFSALHVPVLTLPLFTGPHGCPLGLQLVGRLREDDRLFAVAETVRRELERL